MTAKDHEELHDWIARGALAGAAVSVLELVLGRVGLTGLGAFGVVLRMVAVVAAVVPPRSVTDGAGLLVLGIGAGAMARLPLRLALPATALLVGIGLCRGLVAKTDRLRRRLEVVGMGATAALAAAVIQRAIVEHPELGAVLGVGLVTLLGGAVAGAVIGLGAIGRLLAPAPAEARVDRELTDVAVEVSAANVEVGALLRRAADAHRQATEVIGGLGGAEAPAAQRAADDLIRRMVRFGREWMEIERRASDMKPELLTERVALLEGRLDKTTDPVARQELGRAIVAVRSQSEALAEILGGRERAVARLEHQVATLERLRLAALRHRSADAGRLQAELQPVVEELAEAGGDYDLASDALRDADRETSVASDPVKSEDPVTPATGTALVPATGEQPN